MIVEQTKRMRREDIEISKVKSSEGEYDVSLIECFKLSKSVIRKLIGEKKKFH